MEKGIGDIQFESEKTIGELTRLKNDLLMSKLFVPKFRTFRPREIFE